MMLLLACAETNPPAQAPAPDTLQANAPAVESEAPGPSIYALDVPLVDAGGRVGTFAPARGNVAIYSMFYSTCPMACPVLIQDIQAVEAGLSAAARERLRVVLVSMDPANDTPEALRAIATKHALDSRWTLGTPPEDRVREVASVLGVRYRPLPGGGFAHTSVLTLIDAEGHILARSDGADGRDALVAALERAVGG